MTKHFVRKPYRIEAFFWTGEMPSTEKLPLWLQWRVAEKQLARTQDGSLYERDDDSHWFFLCFPGSWVYEDPSSRELTAVDHKEMYSNFAEISEGDAR